MKLKKKKIRQKKLAKVFTKLQEWIQHLKMLKSQPRRSKKMIHGKLQITRI